MDVLLSLRPLQDPGQLDTVCENRGRQIVSDRKKADTFKVKYDRLNRRMFLKGSLGSFAIPFLPSLLTASEARAAATVLPKYIHVNSPWCLPRAHTYPLYLNPNPSYPQALGTNPNSVPWTIRDVDTKTQSLPAIVAFQGRLSYVLDEKWNPFASRMNLVTNAAAYMADNKFNASVSACASSDQFGGVGSPNGNGPAKGYSYSVDYLLEQAMYRSTRSAPIQTLRVNPGLDTTNETFSGFCWSTENGVEKRIPMIRTVAKLASALQGASTSQTGNGSTQTSNRLSLIDAVLGDYNSLMNHRRVSADDRQRLSNAVDLWRDFELKLKGQQSAMCTAPTLNAGETNWRLIHQMSMDAVAYALACGLTRNVAYGLIQAGDAKYDMEGMSDSRVPGAGSPAITDPFYSKYLRWRSDLMTYFLSKLDSLSDESGSSLLTSSLLTWSHSTSNGTHGMLGHTLISVGTANGQLETGLHVDAGSAPVNRFHLTNMVAMGLSLSDIEKNGRAGFGEFSPNTILAAGGNAMGEHDYKEDDPTKRAYDYSKRSHFLVDSEKRKPFFYLKK